MKKFLITIPFVMLIILFWGTSVDKTLSDKDKKFARKFIDLNFDKEGVTFSEEIKLIKNIQRSVIESVNIDKPIPHKTPRSLERMFTKKEGLCFDRSRGIELILNYYGFQTRHISIFQNDNNDPFVFFKRGVKSHALTEVKTSKGWLIVDSNEFWISIDKDDNPVSMAKFHNKKLIGEGVIWKEYTDNSIFKSQFKYLYGLYSRHGMFYRPYIKLPDINWIEFFYNFLD